MSEGKRFNVRKMAIIGILGSISIVLGMTPLGFIPVGPTKATIMHIPVIIGAILEGPVVGGIVGLIFGLFSIFSAVTTPTPVSFAFLNPLVSVLPRILIGITSYYVYVALKNLGNRRTLWLLNIIWIVIAGYLLNGLYGNIKGSQGALMIAMNVLLIAVTVVMAYLTNRKLRDKALDIIVATIVGTMTNTGLVLGMIYLIYAESFVKALGQSVEVARKVIVGIGIANGIPETIIAILIVTSVVSALENRRG
jgi:uncharacterized membrane protein